MMRLWVVVVTDDGTTLGSALLPVPAEDADRREMRDRMLGDQVVYQMRQIIKNGHSPTSVLLEQP